MTTKKDEPKKAEASKKAEPKKAASSTKAAPKAAAKKPEFKDPEGKRSLGEVHPSRGRAKVFIGETKYKVHYYITRKSKDVIVGIPGGQSCKLSEWLDGKADMGILTALEQ